MDDGAPCPDYLSKLNEAQRAAVLHGREPLLVVAGAGSGKTGTLAHRVAHLMVEGADPRRMLLLTFSRRAAAEMVRRVERIAAIGVRDQLTVVKDLECDPRQASVPGASLD